jgi:CubicO group peptidase (beta-lactamase class C family)
VGLQEYVQAFVSDLVEAGLEDRAQVAVYHRGELVVDVSVGAPVDGLFFSYSTGKGLTATVVHVLAERGLIDYDVRIAEVWPEFGQHGKDGVTLRHALTHSAGVPVLPSSVTAADFADWDKMCSIVAAAEPVWPAGTQQGYHAWTFGWLVGETVRRATGRTLSEVLETEIAGPLGVGGELYFGVPSDALDRVVPLADRNWASSLGALAAAIPRFDLAAPPAVRPGAALGNELISVDAPATATMSARAVARMYAALMGPVDGVRLVSPERLHRMTSVEISGPDWTFGGGDGGSKTLGYAVEGGMVGWSGSGGSLAGMAVERDLAIGITKNLMSFGDGDPMEDLRKYLLGAV